MKKLFLPFIFLLTGILFSASLVAQNGVFKDLLNKKEPVFQTSIYKTTTPGKVMMVYYFTHDKIKTLEVSHWINHHGVHLHYDGEKKLMGSIRKINNREPDTLFIEALEDRHFYSLGLDYRNAGGLMSKFKSSMLQEGYLYKVQERINLPNMGKEEYTGTRNTFPERQQERTGSNAPRPCQEPDIRIQVEPSGYCRTNDRPAVVLQCTDCIGSNWSFAVEARSEMGVWRSLRSDGQLQEAKGTNLRTEPLCELSPGKYYLRVVVKGQYCKDPIYHTVSAPVIIEDKREKEQGQVYSYSPSVKKAPKRVRPLPDTCIVEAQASIIRGRVRGSLRLDFNSPCIPYKPFAKIKYIHPGYRDIDIKPVELVPGGAVPFEVDLDATDLKRGIHPVQVTIYIRPDKNRAGVPVSSFWVRATSDQLVRKGGKRSPVPEPVYVPEETYTTPEIYTENGTYVNYEEQPAMDTRRPVATEKGKDWGYTNDPNCTPLSDLQLIYDPANPGIPKYISWINPGCCENGGCEYSVLAGKTKSQMRLVGLGSKPGSMIRELLEGIQISDQYFEVTVKTSSGLRKAQYVQGKGPVYEKAAPVAYETFEKRPAQAYGMPQGEPIVFKKGVTGLELETPSQPIAKFKACKIDRALKIASDTPTIPDAEITVQYDFKDSGYNFTLYFQPEGATDWFLAPGTAESQSKPVFYLESGPHTNGTYRLLTQKGSGWGCLSKPGKIDFEY